jgi:3-isopropylmalate dehydratase small subunit
MRNKSLIYKFMFIIATNLMDIFYLNCSNFLLFATAHEIVSIRMDCNGLRFGLRAKTQYWTCCVDLVNALLRE